MPAGLRPSPPDHFFLQRAPRQRCAENQIGDNCFPQGASRASSILCSGAFKVDRSVV